MDGTMLDGVHPADQCAGHCPLHSPSDHHMTAWRLLWRDDWGLFERICEHGVGHPDPDDVAFKRSRRREGFGVHGCDGCCWRGP